jgi:hypothetical protein
MTTVETTTTRPAEGTAPGAAPHRTPNLSLSRLILIELRKLADTRAGLWLLIVIGLAAVATTLILLFAAPEEEKTFENFFTFALLPSGVLLPVLGILSMTAEWTQRTALTTFALVPQRGRVITAKLAAAVLISILAVVPAFAFGAAGNLAAGGPWSITWQLIVQCVVLQVVWVLMGSAFGALLLNTPLAIVLFFALPMVWTILGETVRGLRTAASWLDMNVTTIPLTDSAGGLTSGQWARFLVSAAVWVLVPLVLGTVRVLRREVA